MILVRRGLILFVVTGYFSDHIVKLRQLHTLQMMKKCNCKEYPITIITWKGINLLAKKLIIINCCHQIFYWLTRYFKQDVAFSHDPWWSWHWVHYEFPNGFFYETLWVHRKLVCLLNQNNKIYNCEQLLCWVAMKLWFLITVNYLLSFSSDTVVHSIGVWPYLEINLGDRSFPHLQQWMAFSKCHYTDPALDVITNNTTI